jgi:hypothetical protein
VGIIEFFPSRESLVSDIPAGNGNVANLFLQCTCFPDKIEPVDGRVKFDELLVVLRNRHVYIHSAGILEQSMGLGTE